MINNFSLGFLNDLTLENISLNNTKEIIDIFTKDNNYINTISIFVSSIIILTLRKIKKKLINKSSEINENIIVLNNYLNKGIDEFEKLEERAIQDSDKILIESTEIDEITPVGLVKMKYDINKEAFTYYSNEDIPYRYLEVVSRLLVNKLKLKIIYIDYGKELIKARNIFNENNKDKNKNTQKKSSIYAVSNNRKLPENTKHYITPEKSNKYIKICKLRDLEEAEKIKVREELKKNEIKDISFKDFKKKN